jgi:hypothetical protein
MELEQCLHTILSVPIGWTGLAVLSEGYDAKAWPGIVVTTERTGTVATGSLACVRQLLLAAQRVAQDGKPQA